MSRSSENDELLSAYLDGELAPEERAGVERWLAEDPAARRTFEQFQAIRSAIQSLPSHRLDAAFPDQVLRAAERRMLCEPLEVDPSELRPATAGGVQSVLRRALRPRNILWPAVAAAAALLIALWHSDPSRPVADGPAVDLPPVASAPSGDHVPTIGASDRDDGWRASPESSVAAQAGATDDVLVVHCEISVEAVREQTFERILAEHQIRPGMITDDPGSALARLAGQASPTMQVSPQAVASKPVFVASTAT
ncbi:MAG: RseA family anti-sigma factor, partial [Thermoguttaceae bacterium]|nr:RseA family anti-sigma factor [Thermoguttaceae bacterium]